MIVRPAVSIVMIVASWRILETEADSASPVAVADARGAVRVEIDKYIAVLRSGAARGQKLAACKRLALIGGAESVPALASLLPDENLSHAARIALEAIPEAAASDALCKAIPAVKGKVLVGVVNSLGARRDPKASTPLIALLANTDVEVAAAAAHALGRIATPESIDALRRAISASSREVRAAAGDGLLAAAESLARESKDWEASVIYDAVYRSDLPKGLKLAAVRGMILAQGSAGIPLLVSQIKAPDEESFAAALGVSREIAGSEATRAIAEAMAGLAASHKCRLLAALADRGDNAARPAVRQAAAGAEPGVRVAAISALATLGDVSDLEVLSSAAIDPDPQVAAAAASAMVTLNAPGTDKAFADMLDRTTGSLRRILVEIIGQRRITQAVPSLLKAADDADSQTRLAALRALGATLAPDQLPKLTARLMSPKSTEETAAIQAALKEACVRSPDKNTCSGNLALCVSKAGPQNKRFLLELLGEIGGPTALKAISAATSDADEGVQDVATRALGRWMSPDAAPTLLKVARESANAKLRARALRGYVRIIRQMDLPDDRRVTMCHDAMLLAERDEERVLIVQALGRIASPAALEQAVSYLATPSLKQAAASSAVSIAERIVIANRAVAEDAMHRVLAAKPDQAISRRANAVLSGTTIQPRMK